LRFGNSESGGQEAVNMTSREQLIATTFVDLADTLVADFDVIDFLHTLATRSVELLDANAAGIMLADQRGGRR
jgi:hypothetical protein